jgi:hypothetical protein
VQTTAAPRWRPDQRCRESGQLHNVLGHEAERRWKGASAHGRTTVPRWRLGCEQHRSAEPTEVAVRSSSGQPSQLSLLGRLDEKRPGSQMKRGGSVDNQPAQAGSGSRLGVARFRPGRCSALRPRFGDARGRRRTEIPALRPARQPTPSHGGLVPVCQATTVPRPTAVGAQRRPWRLRQGSHRVGGGRDAYGTAAMVASNGSGLDRSNAHRGPAASGSVSGLISAGRRTRRRGASCPCIAGHVIAGPFLATRHLQEHAWSGGVLGS